MNANEEKMIQKLKELWLEKGILTRVYCSSFLNGCEHFVEIDPVENTPEYDICLELWNKFKNHKKARVKLLFN